MTIGPRTLKTLENGPKSEYMGGGHCTWTESHRDFARRVALIAVEEERGRLINNAEALRDPKEATDEYSIGWDSAIKAMKEAAIREGR